MLNALPATTQERTYRGRTHVRIVVPFNNVPNNLQIHNLIGQAQGMLMQK